ncbi:hypothetical protein [Kitasatospora phosalacinea]|uniref:hypothetical protein n=1 Tax=Kitasatospora phosalacinea TaxID=2065 RepID=UPI00131B37E6|nr:hypothetical protein [Kitasatospora phosalacinea]
MDSTLMRRIVAARPTGRQVGGRTAAASRDGAPESTGAGRNAERCAGSSGARP